ncbi:hypothetical protein KAI52_02950 [Candidatus Parcubacteria bacterium]|nr:hypothetical protein [Candidatus Parcubacteria bacterium]
MFDSLPVFDNSSELENIITNCPICGNKNGSLEVSILEDGGNSNLIYIKCHKCFNNLLGVINYSPFGVSIATFATDLKKSEVLKFQNGDYVNSDDVLELHSILEDKKIDFKEIIR